MFDDGMHHQDQLFHQFISSSSSSPPPSSRPPPPPPSSLHQHHLQQISSTPPFPNFDNPSSSFPIPSPQQPTSSHHQSIQFHDLFHRPNLPPFPHLNQSPSSLPHLIIPSDQLGNSKSDLLVHNNKVDVGLIRSLFPPASTNNNLVVEREERSSSSSSHHHSRLHRAVVDDENDTIWSNEEVVALLRIRSSSESSWLPPDFTWEHVSRKLAEIGFKRSSEKCKEKFEEESRTYFNTAFNISTYNGDSNKINNDSYKVFGELEELCRDDDSNNNTDDDQEADEDPINNKQQNDIEVEEAIPIRCEKSEARNNNVFEDITAANEIEDDENYPSPIFSQSADHQLQSDPVQVDLKAKKRVRKQINREHKKFKIMCEGFVKKMMSQQEELHNKILEDLLKRDEVSVAREEGWKRMEMERLDTEIEVRAQELAVASARQAALIDFLNKLGTHASATASQNQNQCNIIDENIVADILKVLPNKPSSHMSKVMFQAHVENDQVFVGSRNPSEQTPACSKSQTSLHETQEPSTIQPHNIVITKMASTSNPPPMLPTSNTAFGDTINNPKPSTKKAALEVQDQISSAMISNNSRPVIISEDYGKRWPRDEVLALINLRCSFMTNNNNNNNGGDEDQRDNNYNNGSAKAPLWERISQKMSELGYKRSAKRCKEKWENINKYFRKTKDNVNKKRSHDSRTCPYFHQLSHLYKQGTLLTPPLDNSLLVDGATNTTYSITDEGAEHVHQ